MAETGMTVEEMKKFVRNHFEQFVNRKNIAIGDVNFARKFVDHGADVPDGLPAGPEGAKLYVGSALKRMPDMRVTIEDIIAEGDKVVVRNTWAGTDRETGRKIRFSGIVIWRIEDRKLVERWAYLEPPQAA
jgi:predicted SnoaL-like aldol condensation-catalyzing enzyme